MFLFCVALFFTLVLFFTFCDLIEKVNETVVQRMNTGLVYPFQLKKKKKKKKKTGRNIKSNFPGVVWRVHTIFITQCCGFEWTNTNTQNSLVFISVHNKHSLFIRLLTRMTGVSMIFFNWVVRLWSIFLGLSFSAIHQTVHVSLFPTQINHSCPFSPIFFTTLYKLSQRTLQTNKRMGLVTCRVHVL